MSLTSDSTEHQRRFVVTDQSIIDHYTAREDIVQAYLWASADGWEIRVRRTHNPDAREGDHGEGPAFFALKGPGRGLSRPEYEVEISIPHAIQLIAKTSYLIRKTRYTTNDEAGRYWSIDSFKGPNKGLIVAEIQLQDAVELAAIRPPPWAPIEVTRKKRFRNSALARTPYARWKPGKRV